MTQTIAADTDHNCLTEQVNSVIHARQSIGQLVAPAPSIEQLDQAIAAALTAPDHKRLRPWQFVLITTDQRAAWGEQLAQAMRIDDPNMDDKIFEKIKQQPMRAPLLLVCLMRYQACEKVSRTEQLLSCGAAVQNLLLMLKAQGFDSIWRTGAPAVSKQVRALVNCSPQDEIVGFIYIGTAAQPLSPRSKLAVADYLQFWSA